MSLSWGKSEREYFAKLGIDVSPEPPSRNFYLTLSSWLFLGLLSGALWYGLLLAGAWALRHMGVHITGI